MKPYFLTVIILMLYFEIYGQSEIQIKGTLVDSVSNEPVAFGTLKVNQAFKGVSDMDGHLLIDLAYGDTASISISAIGYKIKHISPIDIEDSIRVLMILDTFDLDAIITITGEPIDTVYYETGQIHHINFRHKQSIYYYPSGKQKSISLHDSFRSWYENGNLEYQSISYNPHVKSQTEWRENGTVIKHGHICWTRNEEKNMGEWKECSSWIFYNKKGKRKRIKRYN